MNVEVRKPAPAVVPVARGKTAAERSLAAAFADTREHLPGSDAVDALRDAALQQFNRDGLPGRRDEAWKYTDLRGLMREALPLSMAPDALALAEAKDRGHRIDDSAMRRLVFVDGVFAPILSDLEGLSPGVTVRPMAEALANGDPLLLRHLGQVVKTSEGVIALNTALMRDGAFIHVAAGAIVEKPIHLVFAATGVQPSSVVTRSLAVIEPGARIMLVESHSASRGHQVNTMLELAVGDQAHVDHVKITTGADDLVHVSSLTAAVGARARFNTFAFTIGGGVVRNQMFVRFEGADTVAGLRGASLLRGSQHADNTLVVEHCASGCQSREVFTHVLDGQSRGVFQGKIAVRREAQQTDARMMTRSLLLSDDAEADAKPELEIFADDVQCGHGATCGALDEDLRFYLMARGIPAAEAEALLVQAFVGEAIEGIEHAGIREALMEQVAEWLRSREA